MPGPLFYQGETIELRPIEEGDLDFLQQLRNDPAVRAGLGSADPVNGHEEQEWFESIADDDDIHLLICVDGEAVGSIGCHFKSAVWGNAELGYSLTPEEWNNGYTTDAVRAFATFLFEERRLHKLFARAYETNPASQRVLEKVGFEQEGCFRNEAFVGGEYVDIYRYGLLAEEFEPR